MKMKRMNVKCRGDADLSLELRRAVLRLLGGGRRFARKSALSCMIPLFALALSGCGGGGAGPSGEPPRTVPDQHQPPEPRSRISGNPRSPAFSFGSTTHVGASGGGAAAGLASVGERNGMRLREGRIRDGSSASDVTDWLTQITGPEIPVLNTFAEPPTVHVVEGSGAAFAAAALKAVAIVNSVLPYERQLQFSSVRVPSPRIADQVPDGRIYVELSPASSWDPSIPPSVGITDRKATTGRVVKPERVMLASYVLIDADTTFEGRKEFPGDERKLLIALAHEFLHAVGLWGHVRENQFGGSVLTGPFNHDVPRFILGEIDRDGLHAAFTRFEKKVFREDARCGSDFPCGAQVTLENLGAWTTDSFHLQGEADVTGGTLAFGVSTRNGLAQAWAGGPTPSGPLGDGSLDAAAATWEGVILGSTRSERSVTGDASLNVRFDDLAAGRLRFSGLAHDDDSPWGDGDLEYTVRVENNAFGNQGVAGADAGNVTGAFFGRSHEGMGGTLRRQDLTAAFGGTR